MQKNKFFFQLVQVTETHFKSKRNSKYHNTFSFLSMSLFMDAFIRGFNFYIVIFNIQMMVSNILTYKHIMKKWLKKRVSLI